MGKYVKSFKFLMVTFLFILLLQFSVSDQPNILQRILGNWKYELHLYRTVGRYGPKEVDAFKSSLLCFTENKIYFSSATFIDTCFYSELSPKAFFDRKDKESSYFMDGPLAIKYSEAQLSKFIRLDFNCKQNGFGTFYLNGDTLILNSTGGVTFFFTKIRAEPQK